MEVALFAAAAVFALLDWVAVGQRFFRIEYLAKPATIGMLIAAAAVADLGAAKPWVVAALALGAVGDVALLRSGHDADGSSADPAFLAGLGAFLVGHACYVVAFLRTGVRGVDVLAGGLVVAGIAAATLPAVLRGAARTSGRGFAALVAAYAAALATMAVLGVGTGIVLTAIGAVAFLVSDVALARERFVAPLPHGPLAVIVTYHLGQALILLGLLR